MKNVKLIYTDWIVKENITFPLPNGNLKFLNDLAQERAKSMQIDHLNRSILTDLLQHESVKFFQKHDYFYSVFTEFYGIENCVKLEDVDVENPDNLYLYVVECDYNNDNFVDRFFTKENGELSTYSMLTCIPPEIYRLVRQNKVKIIFSCIDNACFESHLQFLDIRFRLQRLPLENFILLSGNINFEYQGNLQQKSVICAIRDIAKIMRDYPNCGSIGYESDYVRLKDLDSQKIRSKKFLSWNRSLNRSHRYALLYLVEKYKLYDSGYFSFLNSFDCCRDSLDTLYSFKTAEVNKICEELESLIPIQLDTFNLTRDGLLSFRTIDNNKKEFYQDSYIHIVSETQFKENRTPYITEKTFRPVMNLQPFIMINNMGALEQIKKLGFKTFHPFIDESYDSESNPVRRWEMISNEILKFHSMPLEEIHKWYHSIQDVLEHNQKKLLEYVSYNILEDLIKELSNGN